jgi:S-adenosylmethionine decarboxylase
MRHSLAQIGVDAEAEANVARAEVENEVTTRGGSAQGGGDEEKDYFVERHGLRYAGSHLIIDLWEAENLDRVDVIDTALRRCVQEAGATLLHIHLHHFTPNGGVSGVAVLAESHISIHTWPERGFAALDVFMCGSAKPHKVIPILRQVFKPGRLVVNEQMRGIF